MISHKRATPSSIEIGRRADPCRRLPHTWPMKNLLILMFLTTNLSNFAYVLTAQQLIDATVNRNFFLLIEKYLK